MQPSNVDLVSILNEARERILQAARNGEDYEESREQMEERIARLEASRDAAQTIPERKRWQELIDASRRVLGTMG